MHGKQNSCLRKQDRFVLCSGFSGRIPNEGSDKLGLVLKQTYVLHCQANSGVTHSLSKQGVMGHRAGRRGWGDIGPWGVGVGGGEESEAWKR